MEVVVQMTYYPWLVVTMAMWGGFAEYQENKKLYAAFNAAFLTLVWGSMAYVPMSKLVGGL